MNLITVKWAQWDKTHSRELLGLFICVCIALCTIVAHNIAQNRHDNFPSYPLEGTGTVKNICQMVLMHICTVSHWCHSVLYLILRQCIEAVGLAVTKAPSLKINLLSKSHRFNSEDQEERGASPINKVNKKEVIAKRPHDTPRQQ